MLLGAGITRLLARAAILLVLSVLSTRHKRGLGRFAESQCLSYWRRRM